MPISYTLTGKCDPSLDVIGTATIGTPNVDKTFTCDDAQKTFSVSLNASGITSYPDATITVSYGSDTETTTVTNNIPQLEVDNMDNPEPLTTSNVGAYPVSGKCNSNLSGQVEVTIEETSANDSSDCDGSSNTFSININATGVVSNLVSMTVTHGTQSEVIEVPNETNSLRIDASLPPINLSNAATYVVTGDCDSLVTGQVDLTLSEVDSNTTVTESSSCASGSFSVELDVSAMRSDTVDISASHGAFEASASVANNIVPLSFNDLVEEFNLSTASNYNLSGKCDSSLSGDVAVNISGTTITENATCSSDNTFTVDLDGSSVTTETLTFQATYGGKTVNSSSIANRIVQFQSISSGDAHTCALTTSGGVKCWGSSSSGRLGNGGSTSGSQFTPVDVHTSPSNEDPLSDIDAISVGNSHTCALTTSGNVKCWGNGGYLGNGNNVSKPAPVNVHTSSTESTPLSDIDAISSGHTHTCALTTSGNVKCWGSGYVGRLGNGDTATQYTPVDVHTSPSDSNSLSDIEAIGAGIYHACCPHDKWQCQMLGKWCISRKWKQ